MANGASAGQREGCDRVRGGVALHNLSCSNTRNSMTLNWSAKFEIWIQPREKLNEEIIIKQMKANIWKAKKLS